MGAPTAGVLVRLAIVLALGVTIIELGVRSLTWQLLRRPVGAGIEILWLAPAMNLIWLGAAAAAALLLRRLWPGRMPASVPIAIVLLPAALTLVWLYPQLHSEAGALLALGLSVQLARVLARRLPSAQRRLRVAAPVLLVLALAAALGGSAVKWLVEWRKMAALPATPDGRNVVLLILDTVRSYSVSGYGYERATAPRMDELMSEGIRFDRAFAAASWTLPSHASMFTGRWPHELSATLRQPLDERQPTLAEAMAGAGWVPGAFAANHSYLNWEHGLARGFIRFDDYPVNVRTLFTATAIGRKALEYNTFRRIFKYYDSSKRKTAEEVNEEFFRWASRLDDRPYLAVLNYFDAHHPYLPPEPYLTKFGPHGDLRYRNRELRFGDLSAREIGRKVNQYDGGIAYVDAAVGAVVDWLRARGDLDRTVIIVTSDHGEHWGDHERLSHGNSMYRQLLQVPLVVRHPASLPSGARVASPVSLRDLPATILALSGAPNALGLPGTSLEAAIDSTAGSLSPVLSEGSALGVPGTTSLVSDGLHYVRRGDGGEELYDLEADSAEVRNLAASPDLRSRLEALRARVDSLTEGHAVDAVPPPIE